MVAEIVLRRLVKVWFLSYNATKIIPLMQKLSGSELVVFLKPQKQLNFFKGTFKRNNTIHTAMEHFSNQTVLGNHCGS